MRKTETVWLDVTIRAVTTKAALVFNGLDEAWLPLSQIRDSEDDLKRDILTKIELPLWLAEESGLV